MSKTGLIDRLKGKAWLAADQGHDQAADAYEDAIREIQATVSSGLSGLHSQDGLQEVLRELVDLTRKAANLDKRLILEMERERLRLRAMMAQRKVNQAQRAYREACRVVDELVPGEGER